MKKPILIPWGDVPNEVYQTTAAMLTALRAKDPFTFEHCLRVGRSARQFAQFIGLNEYQQFVSQFSGFLHDVGKVAVSNEILHKPSRLNEQEIEIIKTHPVKSAEMVETFSHIPFFEQVLPGVTYHHERFDGLGYPVGLAGEAIPLTARLVLIVDTFDAMTQSRPYRKGLPTDAFLAELKKFAGTQFDARLAKIFIESFSSWDQTLVETDLQLAEEFKKAA